jgi:hypothetical protein
VALVLGTVAAVACLLLLIAGHFIGAAGGEGAGGDADSAAPERKPRPPPNAPPPRGLAAAVLSSDDAAVALGRQVGPPATMGSWVSRAGSVCRFPAVDGCGVLTLVVRHGIPHRARSRFPRDITPLAGVGDVAAANERGVWATGGDWSIALTVWYRDGRPADTDGVIALARRILERLPDRHELEAYERGVFGGVRGQARALVALL